MQAVPAHTSTYGEDWQPAVDEKSPILETDIVTQIPPTDEVRVREFPSADREEARRSGSFPLETGKRIKDLIASYGPTPESKVQKAPTIEIETPSSSSPSSSDDEVSEIKKDTSRKEMVESKKSDECTEDKTKMSDSSSSSSDEDDSKSDVKLDYTEKKTTDGEKIETDIDTKTVDTNVEEKIKDRSSSSSSSSDNEEYFEASAEPDKSLDGPLYPKVGIAESISFPDKTETSEMNIESDIVIAKPDEEYILKQPIQKSKPVMEVAESRPEKKVDSEKVAPTSDEIMLETDSKLAQKKRVTFDVPDNESGSEKSSSESESDESDTSETEDKKSVSSGSSSDEQDTAKSKVPKGQQIKLVEIKIKSDEAISPTEDKKYVEQDIETDIEKTEQSKDIETTDLDADLEDGEPKLLSYSSASEPSSVMFIETVSAGKKLEHVEKEKSSSSSESSDSEDSDKEVKSYDISKDSGHSSSDDERKLSEQDVKPTSVTDLDEVRSSGTSVVEIIEITPVPKYELAEGETDLDAVMHKSESEMVHGDVSVDEDSDTGLDKVISELRKIEKGELPELPPGYHEKEQPESVEEGIETTVISETTKTDVFASGTSVGDIESASRFETDVDSILIETPTDNVIVDKETEFIDIPAKISKKEGEKSLVETDIDDLIVELETIEKVDIEKERKLSSSSSSSSSADSSELDKHPDQKLIDGNNLSETETKQGYKVPDTMPYSDKNVLEKDSELKFDENIVLEQPEPFVCIYPVPEPSERASSPELIAKTLEEISDQKESPRKLSSSSSSSNEEKIIIEQKEPWACIYPIEPSERVLSPELKAKTSDEEEVRETSRRSSSSSSSSDQEIPDEKIVIEQKEPWACIYPIEPSERVPSPELEAKSSDEKEVTETSRRSSSSSSSSDQEIPDEKIVIEQKEPWTCIYPIEPSERVPSPDLKAKTSDEKEVRETSRRSSSSSSSSDQEIPGEIIVIEQKEPWTCIYPIAKPSESAPSPELITKTTEEITDEKDVTESSRRSSSCSSSSAQEIPDEKIVLEQTEPWVCIYPVPEPAERASSPELTPKTLEELPGEKDVTEPSHKSSSSSSSSNEDEIPKASFTEKETMRVESVITSETPKVIKKPSELEKTVVEETGSATSPGETDGKEKERKESISSESSSDDDNKAKTLVTDLDEDFRAPKAEKRKTPSTKSSSSSSPSSSDNETETKQKSPMLVEKIPAPKSLETDLDAVEPLPVIETPGIEDVLHRPDLQTDVQNYPKTEMLETDLDAPDEMFEHEPEPESVIETIEPLQSPDTEFAPKHYPDMPFETNVDTMEPEYSAYSIKSVIPVESPVKEGEEHPPEDEVYCETSFTVVRRTKVKQTYATDQTERQPTMIEQAIQKGSKVPALTETPDLSGKRHRSDSLSDEEEIDHPSKRQEFDTDEGRSNVLGEDEAAPPAREYIVIEPTLLTDKTEVKTEYYKREVPYVQTDKLVGSYDEQDTGI